MNRALADGDINPTRVEYGGADDFAQTLLPVLPLAPPSTFASLAWVPSSIQEQTIQTEQDPISLHDPSGRSIRASARRHLTCSRLAIG